MSRTGAAERGKPSGNQEARTRDPKSPAWRAERRSASRKGCANLRKAAPIGAPSLGFARGEVPAKAEREITGLPGAEQKIRAMTRAFPVAVPRAGGDPVRRSKSGIYWFARLRGRAQTEGETLAHHQSHERRRRAGHGRSDRHGVRARQRPQARSEFRHRRRACASASTAARPPIC